MRNQARATEQLARDLITYERNNFAAWVSAMQAVENNPYGAQVKQFGNATIILNQRFSSPILNRVFQLSWDDRQYIPEILAFFREYRVRPMFDISPYDIKPYTTGENILSELAEHGLYQGGFHQLLYGVPDTVIPDLATHLSIEEVSVDHGADEFAAIYEAYSKSGEAIRLLIGHPEYRCYLACVDGKAAGIGLLHMANGVASMATGVTSPEFRNKGCQTALLYHRMREAALAGCHLMLSQCQPGGSSQNNQLAVGFHIIGSKVWWTSSEKS